MGVVGVESNLTRAVRWCVPLQTAPGSWLESSRGETAGLAATPTPVSTHGSHTTDSGSTTTKRQLNES